MANKSQATITVAKITATSAVIVAAISLIGNLVLGYWQLTRKDGDVTPTPAPETNDLPLEKIPQQVFSYAGNDHPEGGWGALWLFYDAETRPVYKLDYSLPSDKYGYAGLAFQFTEGRNLAEYRAIECAITFGDPKDAINLYVKDISGISKTVRISGVGSKQMNVIQEFANFPGVNFNAVREIGFIAASDFITGVREFRVTGIRFVK